MQIIQHLEGFLGCGSGSEFFKAETKGCFQTDDAAWCKIEALGFFVTRVRSVIRRYCIDHSCLQALDQGFAIVLVLTGLLTWLFNPAAAALMVPAVLLWPVVLDSGMRPPRVWAFLLVVVGMLPLLLLLENLLTRYPLGDASSALSWFALLLGASDVGLFPQLWFAAVSGCCIAALLLARHGRGVDAGEADVTVRGPVTYAGPGSLGGVDSALDRAGAR